MTPKTILQLLAAILTVLACFSELLGSRAAGADVSVLSPEVLTDSYGNKADKDSNIDFVTAQDDQDYKARGDSEIDLGAIGPFYGLARSIVDTSFPGGFPYEVVSGLTNGDFDFIDNWQQLALDNLGYIIAVVIGFLFMIIFPIVGLCFCCCRLCGNCGGSRTFDAPEKAGYGDKCGRVTGLVILASMLAMGLTGAVLMYVTNDNVSTSLEDLGNNQIDKLDDVSTFFDSTIQQAEQLVGGNFNFTLDVLFRDLDNIGYLLGGDLRDLVLNYTGLDKTYDDLDKLEQDATSLQTLFQTLKTQKALAEEYAEKFHNFTLNIQPAVDDLATNHPQFDTEVPNRTVNVTSFNATELPDETYKIIVLNTTLNQGIGSVTDESRQNLEDIPERVQNESLQQREDLKNDVGKYRDETKKVTEKLTSLKDDVMGGINFDDLKADGKEYVDTGVEYDKYRWYGGLGLSCVMLLIVLLQGLGMLFGVIGSGVSVQPADRGALSNSGGNMLMAGVGLLFIFGWLTMLVTTVLFAVGAPTEKFVCEPIRDLSMADKLLNDYEILGSGSGNGSWLGDTIFPGKGLNLELSGIMSACQNGEAVYTALKLEEAGVFNLSSILDYSKDFNISEQLGNMNINFNGINISGPVLGFFDLMKTLDVDDATYNSVLSVDPLEPSVTFLANLTNYISNHSPAGTDFQDVQQEFDAHLKDEGDDLKNSIIAIQKAVADILKITREPANNNLTVRTEKVQQDLEDIEAKLETDADKAFKDALKSYEARIKGTVDAFVDDVDYAVNNELGVCTPLWNMYNDLVVYGVCDSTVGALSGWWCAMGWTTFFLLVGSCASVRLAKHFRKMNMSSGKSSSLTNLRDDSDNSMHYFNNKVAHSDFPHGHMNKGFQADEPAGMKF